ncbi:hypothetical protein CTAYLR_010694 [Chrysophaeum taylorii]|uniref:Potassium channel domain-containing protein n=1 Tax=Chrysophaeum taylorii TaxID=2483200 RepID=A0AAD7XJ31_9STRA|nr:hypothetical protein CTAYLR_010694 [Chrysophaeum taylorii]
MLTAVISSKLFDDEGVRPFVRDTGLIVAFYICSVVILGIVEEEWSYIDRVYFISVTVTTVGYGYPEVGKRQSARLFVTVMIIVGMTLIFSLMKQYAMVCHRVYERLHRKVLGSLGFKTVLLDELPVETHTPEQVEAQAQYTRQYASALMPLVVLMVMCFFAAHYRMKLSWSDSLYFTIVTMTTVGYGDISPERPVDRAVCSVFLLALVCVMSNTISEILVISTRCRVRRGKLARVDVEKIIMNKAQDDPESLEEPVVTESEYIVEALLQDGLIDKQIIVSIRRAYYWTAYACQNPGNALHGINAKSIYEKWYRPRNPNPAQLLLRAVSGGLTRGKSSSSSPYSLDSADRAPYNLVPPKLPSRYASSPQLRQEESYLSRLSDTDRSRISYEQWRRDYWNPQLQQARELGRALRNGSIDDSFKRSDSTLLCARKRVAKSLTNNRPSKIPTKDVSMVVPIETKQEDVEVFVDQVAFMPSRIVSRSFSDGV